MSHLSLQESEQMKQNEMEWNGTKPTAVCGPSGWQYSWSTLKQPTDNDYSEIVHFRISKVWQIDFKEPTNKPLEIQS